MPDLGERVLCSEKIFIPPSFPSIIKGYCKAAIRTQPYDLLRWSAAYFRALANGENPPAKERLEFPSSLSSPGLTPGYLKALINQLGKDPTTVVTSEIVARKWSALCLPPGGIDPLFTILGSPKFKWMKFLALAAGSISSSLTQTMILICELLTDEPEGGRATISVDIFVDLYEYLAYLDCGPSIDEEFFGNQNEDNAEENTNVSEETNKSVPGPSQLVEEIENNEEKKDNFESIDEVTPFILPQIPGIGPKLSKKQVTTVIDFMRLWANKQNGLIMPRNIRHWMCPPLENSI